MNPQPVPKNVPLITALGQMGFRLCVLGMIGFLCSLLIGLWFDYDAYSLSLTYQLLISCWGFAAAGGVLFVGTQFMIDPFRKKKAARKSDAREVAYQLARLGAKYRVFNGIDILTANGKAQAYPHVVVGPNGVFCLAQTEQFSPGQQVVLQDLLWSKNIRNVDLFHISLPTPRLDQAIAQQRGKRRLAQAEVEKIAALIEGSCRPSQLLEKKDRTSPLVWMVPFTLFVAVTTWVILGSQVG